MLRALYEAWDRFWFAPTDLVPMACFRIAFGLVAFLNGILLLPRALDWYGAQAVVSPMTVQAYWGWTLRLDLLEWLPAGDQYVAGVLALYLLGAALVTVGLFTRVSAIALFVAMTTLHHHNPLIIHGGDVLLRLNAFYLVFSRAGQVLSLDARFARVKPPTSGPVWPQRLIQLQLCVMYLTTVVLKLSNDTWRNGTALYYAMRVERYQNHWVPYLLDHGWTIHLLSWGTLALEISLAVLIWWKPVRYPLLLLGLAFHGAIAWCMYLPLFGLIVTSTYLVFVDAPDLARVRCPAAIRPDGRQPQSPAWEPDILSEP